jgi:hypothetical protein
MEKIGTSFDNCVGYYNKGTETRDHCNADVMENFKKCSSEIINQTCDQESAGDLKLSLDHIFEYSKKNGLCGKDHILMKYDYVMLILELILYQS